MQNNTIKANFRCVKEHESIKEPPKKEVKSLFGKNFMRNAAVCAMLVIGIWCLSSMDSSVTDRITGNSFETSSSELLGDETLGQLKLVSTEGGVMPVDGEVVTTFSESGSKVELYAEPKSEVKSVLSGTVEKIEEDTLIIQNDNGTRSIYKGVVPSVSVGEYVENSQVIGNLGEEILSLETVSAIGYVDSLDKKELEETMV